MKWIINGLNYIWDNLEKYTQEYTTADNKQWTNYVLKFTFMWWYQTIRTSKEVYEKLEEWKSYILPVWTTTSKNIDFVNIFVKSKQSKIYELNDDGSISEVSL